MADVSVVIASLHGGALLLDTVGAFVEAAREAEIIVVECAADESGAGVRARWPAVHVIHLEAPQTVPLLRAAGFRAATAPIVAMTSEGCAPAPGWFAALRRAHANGADAAGGALELGSGAALIDWAVFFCEYGRYMTPLPAEPRWDLPGHNVSYSRAALAAIDDLVARGTWEPLWHWRLAARGARLVRDGSVVVILWKRYTLAGFVRERFAYGRSFAAQRTPSPSAAPCFQPWCSRALPAVCCRSGATSRGCCGHSRIS